MNASGWVVGMLPQHYITQRHSVWFTDLRVWWDGWFTSKGKDILKSDFIYLFIFTSFKVKFEPHPWTSSVSNTDVIILGGVKSWCWWRTSRPTVNWTKVNEKKVKLLLYFQIKLIFCETKVSKIQSANSCLFNFYFINHAPPYGKPLWELQIMAN